MLLWQLLWCTLAGCAAAVMQLTDCSVSDDDTFDVLPGMRTVDSKDAPTSSAVQFDAAKRATYPTQCNALCRRAGASRKQCRPAATLAVYSCKSCRMGAEGCAVGLHDGGMSAQEKEAGEVGGRSAQSGVWMGRR